MVLAAGLGTRMRPLTNGLPKALVPVRSRPLIAHTLERLERAGIERVVVNVHAHAKRLMSYLETRAAGPEIVVSDERERLLDTGGGIRRALPLLGTEPFFVINVDVLWSDGPSNTLARLAHAWNADQMDALLLVVPTAAARGYDGPGDFLMDAMGRLERRAERRLAPFVFAGIQILSPDLVAAVDETAFPLARAWEPARAAGRLHGLVHDGTWAHVGTPAAVQLVDEERLR
ncbi:MAG: nucleotidyltransferase family protein [Alphaproteobacteria bacterium]|nr:MAG: nucleotidyltransferase family protein [Alphaproteobacteria bacterium]